MGYYNLWLDFLASTCHGLPLAGPAQHQAAFGLGQITFEDSFQAKLFYEPMSL